MSKCGHFDLFELRLQYFAVCPVSQIRATLDKLERRSMDVADDLWVEASELCQNSSDKNGFKTVLLPKSGYFSLVHHPYLLSCGTTGLATWDAAYYMVDFMMSHQNLISKRNVLELGAGTGLTGIALIKSLCPATYVFTDYHESVLARLKENLQLNGLLDNPSVSVAVLDWLNVEERLLKELNSDVVIACDIAYDPVLIPHFFKVLNEVRRSQEKMVEIFLCLKIRNEETKELFFEEAETCGFTLEEQRFTSNRSLFPFGSYDSANCAVFSCIKKNNF
ncbi:protein-lysine N-methyltransferase EEF2KMT-like isoform X2 [Paramacrobiotus metropolitanus]|uniref:protein-lysine N-methyltransferase EEF2KMT-like isoform X2 n=1 Tax=Paramacrobiotus metropolitanus TaxID=2943436 RepID=UPI002445C2E7|nr:protein-lysine N-methyltransferase EEF2KMT-like isoform X2 [Paramacrobiotus metropolitanus]